MTVSACGDAGLVAPGDPQSSYRLVNAVIDSRPCPTTRSRTSRKLTTPPQIAAAMSRRASAVSTSTPSTSASATSATAPTTSHPTVTATASRRRATSSSAARARSSSMTKSSSLRQWDVVRVAPGVARAFAGGPDGLELIAVGSDRPEGGDGEMIQDFWTTELSPKTAPGRTTAQRPRNDRARTALGPRDRSGVDRRQPGHRHARIERGGGDAAVDTLDRRHVGVVTPVPDLHVVLAR